MTISQIDLLNYLNKLLTPEIFEDYAPNGLQIEGKSQIKRVAFAVSATLDSIVKSIESQADALIVHHGIFWKHQGARTISGPHGERIRHCIRNDLNLFAYHLPLDAHPIVGNAASLADKLGLRELTPFGKYKKQFLGIKGRWSSPLMAKDLKIKIKNVLNHEVILASPNENELISSMGIITGGANNDWIQAHEEGLDSYLTGEISEYNWHDSIEAGVHYFAGGHHATERFGIQALMSQLKADFKDLEVIFLDSDNPA